MTLEKNKTRKIKGGRIYLRVEDFEEMLGGLVLETMHHSIEGGVGEMAAKELFGR